MDEPKKIALLYILDILKKYSDCRHPLTQAQIGDHLEREYGITLDRKAISRNVDLLTEAGYEIERGKGCYLNARDFEDSELRLLIDAVLSSKVISATHSGNLIGKISALSNVYFKNNIKHIHTVKDWDRTESQDLFYNIECIDYAIENHRKVSYDFGRYNADKKWQKTSSQLVTPCQMILHRQKYYLIAYREGWKGVSYHSIDRMKNMEVSDESAVLLRDIPGLENGIDYHNISSCMPYLYSDTPETVHFSADARIVDQVVDWFGRDVEIKKSADTDKIEIRVKVSPTAMRYWALQYLGEVEILSPRTLRDAIQEDLKNGLAKYQSS